MRSAVAPSLLFLALSPACLAAQDLPKVTSLEPANGAVDVDAGVRTLTIEFDRPMGRGRSVVGGGPNFPKVTGTRWVTPKRFVIDVELEADHSYLLGLNSRTFTNFRSANGTVLPPVVWRFSTLPKDLPDPRTQKARNKKATSELEKLLPSAYSYYDRKVRNWKDAFEAARPAMLDAKTDAAWANAAARMLRAAEDLHLYLRLGERTFGTHSRAIDPLYRFPRIRDHVAAEPLGNSNAAWGRTADNIGYVMISSWSGRVDLDAIETGLAKLSDTRALILDVRPNSGGNENLARRIAQWFVDGKKVYAKNRYRTRKGKKGFGPVLSREIEGNKDAAKQYQGPVAVLTSRYVMSSCEGFVLMMRQGRNCTVVGQPTFGSSGNPQPHELSNGVIVFVPSWQAMRPDGSCFEGEGIAPDVAVPATPEDMKTSDPILRKALEILRGKTERKESRRPTRFVRQPSSPRAPATPPAASAAGGTGPSTGCP